MIFKMPQSWEENGDGTRCGPFVYLGKIYEGNPYTPADKPANSWHRYLCRCVRMLKYTGCTFEAGEIVLGTAQAYKGVRPYSSLTKLNCPKISGYSDLVALSRYEGFDPDVEGGSGQLLAPGYLYNRTKIWGGESGEGTPGGSSTRRLDSEGLLSDDFKLVHLGETTWWWTPESGDLDTLATRWASEYPGVIAEGEEFNLVFYAECWTGRIDGKNEEGKFILLSTDPEDVDLWVTAFFM